MSTAALASSLLSQSSASYFQQRKSEIQQLGQDLSAGNLSAAQQDFSNLQTLAQNGPLQGDAFVVSGRQQDFSAIGQALQSGDVASAQQAYAQLQSTFNHRLATDPPTAQGTGPSTSGSSTSQTGSEIVLNLGNLTPGEQVNINIANNADGSDQITVGVSNGQSSTPEQISFNVNPTSNQEIVLNLFNSAPTTASQTGALSVNG